jgi:uncharacterized membrane protein (DUF485 family)
MANSTPPDWEALARQPGFQALLAAKKRFVIPCCIFFLLYYFALLYLVGWHADLMKRPLLGKINGAYIFALSQFFMAWGMAWLYMRRVAAFDRMAAEVIANETH